MHLVFHSWNSRNRTVFLSFVSTHPCVCPNWNIIWLQPFDLAAVILFTVKKLRKAAYYYHFINFAALTLMLAGWHFIPQHLNTAFIPLVMSLWLRSGYGVYRKIWNIGYEKYLNIAHRNSGSNQPGGSTKHSQIGRVHHCRSIAG